MNEKKENPCRAAYGPGPEGTRCKDCALLLAVGYHREIRHKCDLRTHKVGRSTNHKVNWPTCARFQPITGERKTIFVA